MEEKVYSLSSIKERLNVTNRKIDYKNELNEEQYNVVMHNEGPLLVLAGAGAGKTRALTYRVARLIEDGVAPSSILLLTFTKHASNEMLTRASQILDGRCKEISGGTYHSFASLMLRRYGKAMGLDHKFTLMDSHDAKEVMAMAKEKTGLNSKGKGFPTDSALVDIYSSVINKHLDIRQVVNKKYQTYIDELLNIDYCIREYNKLKRQMNVMDYDDLLVFFLKLLKEYPDTASKISDIYRYIMVDEYQDSNYIQSEILKMLCRNHKNLMVVGDEQQSMYAFRGAKFENIMNFPKQFEGCKVLLVTTNYRCTQGILNLANVLITNAKEKYPKTLKAISTVTAKPLLVNVYDSREEAMFICNEILEKQNEGNALKGMAVLCRNAYNSAELEIMFSQLNIPFKKVGGIKFLEQAHIKDYIAYLRVLLNVRDTIAWMRLLKLIKGLGTKGAERIVNRIMDLGGNYYCALTDTMFSKNKYYGDMCALALVLSDASKLEFCEQILYVAKEYYCKDVIKYTYKDDWKDRLDDIDTLINIGTTYTNLDSFLSAITLESDVVCNSSTTKKGDEEEITDYVTISTIHSAKGLEWDTVFMLDCVEGVLPSYQCVTDEDFEEERRVFYVAVTRAKFNLYMLRPKLIKKYKDEMVAKQSRFLTEDGISRCLDIIKVQG